MFLLVHFLLFSLLLSSFLWCNTLKKKKVIGPLTIMLRPYVKISNQQIIKLVALMTFFCIQCSFLHLWHIPCYCGRETRDTHMLHRCWKKNIFYMNPNGDKVEKIQCFPPQLSLLFQEVWRTAWKQPESMFISALTVIRRCSSGQQMNRAGGHSWNCWVWTWVCFTCVHWLSKDVYHCHY